MRKSIINKFIEDFQDIFSDLNIDYTSEDIEQLACLVHNAMMGVNRRFHTPEHVFTICKNLGKPLQRLSAIFHDLVYYQIDECFPPNTEKLLHQFVEEQDGQVKIRHDFPAEDSPLAKMCLLIFGFEHGEVLSPFSGLNEFLSALIAVHELRKVLTTQHLVGIAAMIEGTIPFRLKNAENKTNPQVLAERLQQVNSLYQVGLDDENIDEIVTQSVDLANKDVENFSDKDTGRFLDNTWLLLSESNKSLSLLRDYSYQIPKYRQGLSNMELFLNVLQPDSIFHEYKSFPPPPVFAEMNRRAKQNILIAREYLGAKLLSISIIEALAECSGGKYVPVSMFTGGIRNHLNSDTERAEDYLPPLPDSRAENCNPVVLNLLEYGRSSETSFDMKQSPISAFIYQAFGSQKTKNCLAEAKRMFNEEISAEAFLQTLDAKTLDAFARACAELAPTRREALKRFFVSVNQTI